MGISAPESGGIRLGWTVPSDGDGETVAVDPQDLRTRLIARDGSLVVSVSRSGAMYWVPGQDLQGLTSGIIVQVPQH